MLENLFPDFRRWFISDYTCIKCHKKFKIMSFGFGEGICPDCYDNEPSFVLRDNSYFLNRIITRLENRGTYAPKQKTIKLEIPKSKSPFKLDDKEEISLEPYNAKMVLI